METPDCRFFLGLCCSEVVIVSDKEFCIRQSELMTQQCSAQHWRCGWVRTLFDQLVFTPSERGKGRAITWPAGKDTATTTTGMYSFEPVSKRTGRLQCPWMNWDCAFDYHLMMKNWCVFLIAERDFQATSLFQMVRPSKSGDHPACWLRVPGEKGEGFTHSKNSHWAPVYTLLKCLVKSWELREIKSSERHCCYILMHLLFKGGRHKKQTE